MPKLNGKTIFLIVFFLGIFSGALLLLAYLFTGSTLLSLLSLVQEAASKLEPFDIPIELSPFVEPRIHDFLYDGHRARILVHIGTVFDPSGAHADRSYQLRLLEDLQRGAFMCWNSRAATLAQNVYIPPEAIMVICVDAECLHGKEWEATLEVEALVGLVLESFLVHETLSVSELTPAAFFNISSNNRGFIADIAAVFQKQFMVSLLERGGYSFVCVPHLEGVAPGPGDLPGSDYSVELIRCFGPYPGKSALQGTDIALYELSFVDKGFPGLTIEPLPGVAPSGAPEGVTPSGAPEGVTPSGAPEGVTPFYPSVLEERPRSTGDYGDWTVPPRPAFWRVREYYHYSWLEAHLAEPRPWYAEGVHNFYHYLAALIYFDPIPLSARPTTIVTELSPYFRYPFSDTLTLRPDVGDNLSFYRGLKGWGWDGRGYPTVPLCGGGRYTLLLEASEGVLDYLRMCACLSGEYDYRTLPLQAPSDYFPQYSWRYDSYRIIPLEYTAAGENAAFGPEGEWSNQRWLEIRDVWGYRVFYFLCKGHSFLWWCYWDLVLEPLAFALDVVSYLEQLVLWFFWSLCVQWLWGHFFLKLFFLVYGCLLWALTVLVLISCWVAQGLSALGTLLWLYVGAPLFWFLEVDPRSLVAIAVHLGEALLWALAYGYYVVSFYGPWKLLLLFLIWCHGCLVLFQAWCVHWLLLFLIWCHGCLVLFQAWCVHWLLLFLIWCHGCLVLFQAWVFAGLLFSYSIFVTGTKSALVALWQGYVSVAIMGTKSALVALWQLLSGASFSWGSLWQGWHWICAAFYGLQGVVLGTLPQLYGQGLFFFLNLCRVLFYAFRLLFGVPLSLFLLVSFGGAFGSGFYGLTRYLRARPLERLRKALSAPRKILIEKIYRKFIRCYLDTLFSHSLWWYLQVEHYILGTEIYSFQAVAFKEYIRMVSVTLISCAYYWFHCYVFQRAPRWLLRLTAASPLAIFITPIIFFFQLRALNMKMEFIDREGTYEWAWRFMENLRTGYHTLLNIDNFWSLAASFGAGATEEKAIDEIPERPSITVELFSDFFSAVVTFFRPPSADNYTAAALEPQRPRNNFWNFLGFWFFQGLYYLTFAIVGALCLVIPGFLRLRFFCIQWRLRWLKAFTWLEAQPATAYVARWVRYFVACLYSGVPRAAARRLLLRGLRPCYEGLLFLGFLMAFIPLRILLVLKYFFFLLIRGRWVILGLWAVFFFGVHSLCGLAAEGLWLLITYDLVLLKDLLGRVDLAFFKACRECYGDGELLAKISQVWWDSCTGFGPRWLAMDLVDKTKQGWHGIYYFILWFFYFCYSKLPPEFFYVQRFFFYYCFYGLCYCLEVMSPRWTSFLGHTIFGESYWMALLAARDQGLAFLATTACSFVDFSTATLNRCAEGAFQLALRGLPESLVGSDTLMYGRWLWHYAFWDFFNLSFYRKCGSLCIEPFFPWYGLGDFIRDWQGNHLAKVEPASAVTNLAIIVAVFAVLERLLDGLWLEFWLAWGPGLSLPYKVLGAYSLKYKLWIHWRLLLDDFFMAFRLKPLQLSLEDVPLAHHNLYLEDWLYLEFRNYNYKTSVLSFMHEPYVAWAIRRAAEPLSLSVEESILNSRGRKKVIWGVWGLGLSHFWFLLAILLVVSKGLRHALWMPSTSTSGEALWRSFKEEPTAAVIEALLHVPDFVEERYRYELQSVLKEIERKRIGGRKLNLDDFPGEPWRFYNIAAIILEDRYSTQDPVEALRLYLAQAQAGASGHLGQRLAYQGLLGRLWGPESNREDFFRYVFRRNASGKESAEERFDERLRRKARRLFGKDNCRFLRHHEFDFLHWYLDARKEKATLGAQLLNLLTYRQLMFFIAYLFSKDKRIGDIYRFANFGEMEPVCPTYALFIDRHIGSLELVLDYYRGLDSTFFGNRLPLWVCHKDPQDFIVHEDQTPWLNTKSVEAPRDYNYDFTNEGQRSFYESDTLAEPLYNWTWWFFWAPLYICWFLHLLLFGVLDGEGSLVSRVEISYILERILAHLDVLGLEPFYGRYSAVSIRVGDPSVFPMGPYDELEVEIDLTRGQRWLYSWEEETAVARGLYIKRSSNLNFWWDLKPTWGLLAGRPGYRFLEALLLLCLGRALWWFYVPMAFFKSLGLYLEKKKYLLRFFSIYGPLRGFGPELVSFRQYWKTYFYYPFEATWYFRFFRGWRARHEAASPSFRPVLLSALPEKLHFRKFYGLKFYYALKEHARVGIVAHGRKGYSFRAATRACWKKKQDLEG